uniref:GCN5-like N-acetyltransferase n=1 Tax=Pulvinaster venetus TaxID=427767 RepID=UPI001FCE1A73|nr:GCN5-like N-acetyltransferase [Pulvinaster venetus]UNJ16871.1 GCN5-like N-acetyltransferase [Pulvinaster venetus]
MIFWKLLLNNLRLLSYNNTTRLDSMEIIYINNNSINISPIPIYLTTTKNINLTDLDHLCRSVGWIERPIAKVQTAINNSFITISLFYKNQNNIYLIGFARATSDGAFNATIWDVVVHPQFQGKGLGKLLIKSIIKKLKNEKINTITLFADPQVVKFYNNLGFIVNPNKTKGMFWHPK